MPMSVLLLSRWQFGITTVYHFIFVPLTLSLSYLIAGMQTAWLIKKDDVYLRMTKFFGKIRLAGGRAGAGAGPGLPQARAGGAGLPGGSGQDGGARAAHRAARPDHQGRHVRAIPGRGVPEGQERDRPGRGRGRAAAAGP